MNLCDVGYEFTLINYDVLEVDEKMLLFFFPFTNCMEARKKDILTLFNKGKKTCLLEFVFFPFTDLI